MLKGGKIDLRRCIQRALDETTTNSELIFQISECMDQYHLLDANGNINRVPTLEYNPDDDPDLMNQVMSLPNLPPLPPPGSGGKKSRHHRKSRRNRRKSYKRK